MALNWLDSEKLFEKGQLGARRRTMRRIIAIWIVATLHSGSRSSSLQRRRLRPSQAKVRSTTQRRGNTAKPLCSCGRWTGLRRKRKRRATHLCKEPRSAPSPQIRRSFWPKPQPRLSSCRAPSRSGRSAAVTRTANVSTSVSTRRNRFRPVMRLPPS